MLICWSETRMRMLGTIGTFFWSHVTVPNESLMWFLPECTPVPTQNMTLWESVRWVTIDFGKKIQPRSEITKFKSVIFGGSFFFFWNHVIFMTRHISTLPFCHRYVQIVAASSAAQSARAAASIAGAGLDQLGFSWILPHIVVGWLSRGTMWFETCDLALRMWGRKLRFFRDFENLAVSVVATQYIFYFHPTIWGRFSIWPCFFQRGWNHQLVIGYWCWFDSLSHDCFFNCQGSGITFLRWSFRSELYWYSVGMNQFKRKVEPQFLGRNS